MRFLEVTFQNFRSYSNENVKFEEESDKPVFSFVGKNGAGKTSFFLGLMWALYGQSAIQSYAENRPSDKQAPRNNYDLLNADARQGSDRPSMRVSLIFEHNGQKYFLYRTAAASTANPRSNRDMGAESLKLTIEGKGKEETYPQGVIDDILPSDAFQFFFFDGEDVRRYSGATSDLTKDAIEQVLGIPEIKDGRDDFERIQKKLLKQLQSDPDLSENVKRMTEGLTGAIDDHKKFSDALEERKNELTKTREERIQAEARRQELKDIADLNVVIVGGKYLVIWSQSIPDRELKNYPLEEVHYLLLPTFVPHPFRRCAQADPIFEVMI